MSFGSLVVVFSIYFITDDTNTWLFQSKNNWSVQSQHNTVQVYVIKFVSYLMHEWNWLPQNDWTIFESGIKHP